MNKMTEHDVAQGSEAWLALRGNRTNRNASEAPIIMGCHPNMRRDELLHAKFTMQPKEFSDWVQEHILDYGHEVEAKARVIIEKRIGESLYPVTGTIEVQGCIYLASFDGLTMDASTEMEHKQWSEKLVEYINENGEPPPYIYWQLEHQFIVNPDLIEALLVVSDGTEANMIVHSYRPVLGRRQQLIDGWDQFMADLEVYVPVQKAEKLVGTKLLATLPEIEVKVSGQLSTIGNLAEFRRGAELLVASIKTNLETDQDFADAEEAVKWLKEREQRIDAQVEQMLQKTGDFNTVLETLRDVRENLVRKTRLALEPKIKKQKEKRKDDIVVTAKAQCEQALAAVAPEFAAHKITLNVVTPDFWACIARKKSFDLMVSACNDEVANFKLKLKSVADGVRANLNLLLDLGKDHLFLFPNKAELVYMQADHLKLTIESEIRKYDDELKRKDEDRKQRHRNTIIAIQAAGESLDEVELSVLEIMRKRVVATDTALLEEFAAEGQQVKVATLRALDVRISALQQAMAKPVPPVATVAAPAAASSVINAPTARLAAALDAVAPDTFDDVSIHDAVPGSDDLEVVVDRAIKQVNEAKTIIRDVLYGTGGMMAYADECGASHAQVMGWADQLQRALEKL